jgi:ankyrin repeat protein
MRNDDHELTAAEVLRRYQEEDLPEFVERQLDVNQAGNFGNYPIHVAAVREDIDELQALINAGADVNAIGEKHSTPRHDAVGQGDTEAVKLLLARGARATIKNQWGGTALDVARIYKRDDLIELLRAVS